MSCSHNKFEFQCQLTLLVFSMLKLYKNVCLLSWVLSSTECEGTQWGSLKINTSSQ